MRASLRIATGLTAILSGTLYLLYPSISTVKVSAEPRRQVLASYANQAGTPNLNDIFALVNQKRAAQGLQPVTRNAKLTAIAEQRAADMAQNHYYAHKSPSGLYFYDLIKQHNYQIGYGCENLDLEFTQIAEVYVTDWLNSTHGHRECLLNSSVTDAGFAVTAFVTSDGQPDDEPAYIVVTIYAQVPTKIAQK